MADQQPLLEAGLATASKVLSDFASGPWLTHGHHRERGDEKLLVGRSTIARAATRQDLDGPAGRIRSWRISTASRRGSSSSSRSRARCRLSPARSCRSAARARRRTGERRRALSGGRAGARTVRAATSGAIAPNSALGGRRSMLNVQASDAQSFLKSESQIAAMLSRALARGQRNM